MRALSLALTAALAATAVAAAPALDDPAPAPLPEGCRLVDVAETPDDETDDVQLCEQQLFVRAGDAPVSNLSGAVFSTEAPAGAPVGGAAVGGSVTDIAVQGDPAHGLEVTGTFTGAVDTVDVEVYLLMPNGTANGSHGTTPALEVNGFNFGGGALVDTTVEAGPNGTAIARFRIDGMLDLWPALGFSHDPAAEHSLRLNLSPYYFGDDGVYLYDGTSVPSNVVLNAAD